jgi:hypothetical protein
LRPVPIPDEFVWPGGVRRVIAGPDGDLTGEIRPVEAIIDSGPHGTRFCILVRLDDGDLERLREDPRFWLLWWGDHLHPFGVEMPER